MPGEDVPDSFIRALGLAVRAFRRRAKLSQEQLSADAGLDRTYLSGVERGIRSPNIRTIVRVAAALNLRFSELVIAAEQLENQERARP